METIINWLDFFFFFLAIQEHCLCWIHIYSSMPLLDTPYLTRWEAGLFVCASHGCLVSHLTQVVFWADYIMGCSDFVKCPKWCWPRAEKHHTHRTQSYCLCWTTSVGEWDIKSGLRILLQMQVLMGFYHFSSVKLQFDLKSLNTPPATLFWNPPAKMEPYNSSGRDKKAFSVPWLPSVLTLP